MKPVILFLIFLFSVSSSSVYKQPIKQSPIFQGITILSREIKGDGTERYNIMVIDKQGDVMVNGNRVTALKVSMVSSDFRRFLAGKGLIKESNTGGETDTEPKRGERTISVLFSESVNSNDKNYKWSQTVGIGKSNDLYNYLSKEMAMLLRQHLD